MQMDAELEAALHAYIEEEDEFYSKYQEEGVGVSKMEEDEQEESGGEDDDDEDDANDLYKSAMELDQLIGSDSDDDGGPMASQGSQGITQSYLFCIRGGARLHS